jgi:hypothetical protein
MVLVDVDDGAIAQFARHRCKCSGNRQHHSFLPNTRAAHAGLFAS